jgi:hypothetical protein
MHLLRAFVLGALALAAGTAQAPTPSALQSSPKGWIDLLSAKEFKEWTRVPLGAAGKLRAGSASDPSPWKLDATGKILLCEGDKTGHEMFRYVPELGDLVLHVEWRFTKLEGEPAYNAGVFVRTGPDGAIWIQAQTGSAGGYLFGNVLVNGAPQRFNLREKMTENRVLPAGEWNTYEIRAVGKTVTLWVNGAVVNEYAECEMPSGFIGLEAEGYRIEFRNVRLKKL